MAALLFRLFVFSCFFFGLFSPVGLAAASRPVTVLFVEYIHGTVELFEASSNTSTSLSSDSVVPRGAKIRVLDQSYLILKSPKGDKIGVDAGTEVDFDEIYASGPDRQLRLLLRSGRLLIQSKPSKSFQSYFEVHAGNIVFIPWKSKTILTRAPEENVFEVQFLGGDKPKIDSVDREGEIIITVKNNTKVTRVVDASGEIFFPFPSRRVWKNGQLTQEDPLALGEAKETFFSDFFQKKFDFFHLRGPGAAGKTVKGFERDIHY